MSNRKNVYPQGIMIFEPNAKAPDFVKGTVILSMDKLKKWFDENKDYHRDYQGEKQLKLNLLEGDKGYYMTVDTYQPNTANTPPPIEEPFETVDAGEGEDHSDLPF